jgi:hypothetical protein
MLVAVAPRSILVPKTKKDCACADTPTKHTRNSNFFMLQMKSILIFNLSILDQMPYISAIKAKNQHESKNKQGSANVFCAYRPRK